MFTHAGSCTAESLSSPPELKFRATARTVISGGSHCWNGNRQWLTQLFIVCLCMQMSDRPTPPIAVSTVALNSSSGGELRLYLDLKRHTTQVETHYYIMSQSRT